MADSTLVATRASPPRDSSTFGQRSMIHYSTDQTISEAQFIDILKRSGLGERRPIDDLVCMEAMVGNADLITTAWHGDTLVGIARSVTDFCYCCYLSDLAVDRDYQSRGIGSKLISVTQAALEPRCKIILLAAPAAASYYPRVGFQQHDSAWVLSTPLPK